MNRLQRTNHGRGHSYTIDGFRAPGVTTVMGKVLDKPALVGWAAKESAKLAVNEWDRLAKLDPFERFEQIKGARFNTNREATTSGKRIHDLGERLANGEQVEVPDELRDRVEAYARFLDDWQIETIVTECPVGHSSYRYAGTVDLVAKVGRLDGMPLVLDIKTGRGVYSETAMQLTAYSRCDLLVRSVPQPPGPRGGKRKPLQVEDVMPATVGAAVAHVIPESADGPARVDFLPVRTDDDVWHAWLYVLELYRIWWQRTEDNSSTNFGPPICEPLYPEQTNPYPLEGED